MSTPWNPVTRVSEMSSDGWYWDGIQRYPDRKSAELARDYYLSREAPLMESKVAKRGGAADPHFRVVYRLAK